MQYKSIRIGNTEIRTDDQGRHVYRDSAGTETVLDRPTSFTDSEGNAVTVSGTGRVHVDYQPRSGDSPR